MPLSEADPAAPEAALSERCTPPLPVRTAPGEPRRRASSPSPHRRRSPLLRLPAHRSSPRRSSELRVAAGVVGAVPYCPRVAVYLLHPPPVSRATSPRSRSRASRATAPQLAGPEQLWATGVSARWVRTQGLHRAPAQNGAAV
jgi:hypothetical protein